MTFSLVLDDFGVKYVGNQHAGVPYYMHPKYYPVSVYWTGELYFGVSLDWDYKYKNVTLSMPGYVEVSMD